MSQILSYTPEWLSQPHPGHQIFAAKPANAHGATEEGPGVDVQKEQQPGPRRTIALRGTEVFVAVGREIRWADLVYLRDAWENAQEKRKGASYRARFDFEAQFDENHAQGYRTIYVPVAGDIRQLVISPKGDYLAVLTTHTLHVLVLPNSSKLTDDDDAVLQPKSHLLGPTTHVASREPISTALWHPLGVNGSCLVTITKDAKVRLWEISMTDRLSFNQPTLAIDLITLINSYSIEDDVRVKESETGIVFSPDTLELQVASACFAARGTGEWASMTLWVATRYGSVYALCPLLPEKWSPPPELIPSLSVAIVAKAAAIENDPGQSNAARRLVQQQQAWLAELDKQEPIYKNGIAGQPIAEIYSRPALPGAIPRLQGPLEMQLAPSGNDEVDYRLSDIHVIGGKLNVEDLMFGEDDDLEVEIGVEGGLSSSVICLLSSSSQLSIYLDLVGLQAQWLPKESEIEDNLTLESPILHFDTLDTTHHSERWEGCWPTFSIDVDSRYSFHITDTSSITYISLASWVDELEIEMSHSPEKIEYRLDMLVRGEKSVRKRVYTVKPFDPTNSLATSITFQDPDLGHMLLTCASHDPIALTFESPQSHYQSLIPRPRSPSSSPIRQLVLPRPVYSPPHTFVESTELTTLIQSLKHSKYRRLLHQEIRLSPAALSVMSEAHRLVGEITHRVGSAAAELFRRCEFLQLELKDQIEKVCMTRRTIRDLGGEDAQRGLVKRMETAKTRQKEIARRFDRLRGQLNKERKGVISKKEKAWMREVRQWEGILVNGKDDSDNQKALDRAREFQNRYQEVKRLAHEFLKDVHELQVNTQQDGNAEAGSGRETATADNEDDRENSDGLRITKEMKKKKVANVLKLLDRGTALVEGATLRLEGLSLG